MPDVRAFVLSLPAAVRRRAIVIARILLVLAFVIAGLPIQSNTPAVDADFSDPIPTNSLVEEPLDDDIEPDHALGVPHTWAVFDLFTDADDPEQRLESRRLFRPPA